MSVTDVENAALALPEKDLIQLVDRLFKRVNRISDQTTAERIALADEREHASEADPEGDSDFDEFLANLKTAL